jgi:hypothetical protein
MIDGDEFGSVLPGLVPLLPCEVTPTDGANSKPHKKFRLVTGR